MKTLSIKKIRILAVAFAVSALALTSCNRNDEEADDLPQEELSNVVLVVKDVATGTSASYDYQLQNKNQTIPTLKLEDGHTYDVSVNFMNGTANSNSEIQQAKDEHFLVYNFPNADISLTRTDDANSTRTDGTRVGLKTRWKVARAVKNSAAGSQLVLTLFHESKTASETSAVSGNGMVFGMQSGGETDAQAIYNLTH